MYYVCVSIEARKVEHVLRERGERKVAKGCSPSFTHSPPKDIHAQTPTCPDICACTDIMWRTWMMYHLRRKVSLSILSNARERQEKKKTGNHTAIAPCGSSHPGDEEKKKKKRKRKSSAISQAVSPILLSLSLSLSISPTDTDSPRHRARQAYIEGYIYLQSCSCR